MGKGFDYQQVANTVADNYSDRATAASIGSFVNTALQVYQQHLQQQKLDTLANTIMASQNTAANQDYAVANAKPATAVQADDPDLEGTADYNEAGGDVYDYRNGASPGDPPTRAQEAADNIRLGFVGSNPAPTLPAAPGTLPATGGYDALRLRRLMEDDQARRQLQQARVKEALAQAQKASTPPINTHTASTPYGMMTPGQAAAYYRSADPSLRRGGGMGAARGPQPQADSIQKLNSDLQARWGADLGEFRDAGAEDTVQQPDGVLYRLGGGKGANGQVQPKREVFMPQADHDVIMDRFNRIVSGKPGIINQPQMNAVQLYKSGGGAGTGSSGATPPTAGAMQQAQDIKAQVRAGKLSQEDAFAQLQALGFD